MANSKSLLFGIGHLKSCLQVVSDFVAAINEDLLNQCHIEQGGCTFIEEIIAFFPTMPQTSSALALWLVKLDEFIAPFLKKVHSEREVENGSRCSGIFQLYLQIFFTHVVIQF